MNQSTAAALRVLAGQSLDIGRLMTSRAWRRLRGEHQHRSEHFQPGLFDIRPTFVEPEAVAGFTPGDVIRHTAMHVVGLGSPRHNPWRVPAHVERMEFVTTDSHGRRQTATGGVIHPRLPWTGPGPRPTIAIAPATQGVAKHCDPSLSLALGFRLLPGRPFDFVAAYELPTFNYFVARGANVVFTDYPRNPDTGIQYYCDHVASGHSLVDAVRAATHLGIPPGSPLGLWGFSQGGGAVCSALERPSYAAGLPLRAAVAGVPPVDLSAVLDYIDGTMLVGVLSYAIAGLAAQGDAEFAELAAVFNETGLAEIGVNLSTCAGGMLAQSGYHSTSSWTLSGLSLTELLTRGAAPAVSATIERQKLGKTGAIPSVPLFLWGSAHDDVIPVGPVRELARRWQGAGAPLTYWESALPDVPGRTSINHNLPYFTTLTRNADWLMELVGRPK
ncbi:lipase family protein [Corynebacterium pyruviciproducens]|uniref:lipase family protein n=1 Tax=Corynebacterium pyruviciproducens TaxID=598660 RepID=UPI0023F56C3D|nr:lipase family protein [Corynebacterium pyruviciproducens]MDK7215002.1 lipase family protein [Corynebacterium pyruviciproducens]